MIEDRRPYSVGASVCYYKAPPNGFVVAPQSELTSKFRRHERLLAPIWCQSYEQADKVARALNHQGPSIMTMTGGFLFEPKEGRCHLWLKDSDVELSWHAHEDQVNLLRSMIGCKVEVSLKKDWST